MSINKKITIAVILLVIEIALIIFSGVFVQSHSVSIKYNDNKILGKTPQEIVEEYGLFDIAITYGFDDGDIYNAGYYLRPTIDSNDNYYYCIYFDENGVAYDVNEHRTNFFVSKSLLHLTKSGNN